MSNRKGKRFNSACSVIEERNFFSFLEPNSAKNSSKKIADFTRDTSPQIFSAIISPKSPNNFGKKLLKPEFLMKKNALILERAQVLSKANKELKKQLEKKCLAPKDLFKTHAVHLTRESFSKVYSDLDIAEPFREIKKVLAWISAQKDEFCIKNVKHAIEKISGIVTNLQVETEAKMQILTLEYEKTIKNLEEKVAVLGKNSTEKEKNITKSLVSKNLQLSATINRLEKVVNEQTKSISYLKTELEENKGSTENMEFKSIDTEDLKKSPRPDREKCLPHIEELEKKVKMMSTVINILDSQMSSKDKQLQRNNAEILLLKSKLSDCNFAFNRARHSSQKDFQVKIPQSEPIHPDILNFFTCIAGALESLL